MDKGHSNNNLNVTFWWNRKNDGKEVIRLSNGNHKDTILVRNFHNDISPKRIGTFLEELINYFYRRCSNLEHCFTPVRNILNTTASEKGQ